MPCRPQKLRVACLAALLSLGLGACNRGDTPASATGESPAAATAPAQATQQAGYQALINLMPGLRELRSALQQSDFSESARAGRLAMLEDLQRRLADIDPASWDRAQQADYLAVRAQLDEQEFILRVTQPWSRDPMFYLRPLLSLSFTELPLDPDAAAQLRQRLETVPQQLATAQRQLSTITRDHGEHALFHLRNSDGVGQDHPARPRPPAGIIGWYEDLAARATESQPELRDAVDTALSALEDFERFLQDGQPTFTAANGVGEELLDWFLRHALLIPHSSSEILVIAERELERLRAFHALERHRNQGLPELTLPTSEEAYLERIAATDAMVRQWLQENDYISIPDFIPSDWREMGFNVPWVERGTPPNFWEQVQYRDPIPDHVHAVIPGHRYDLWFERQSQHPIRAHIRDAVRYQGWADYIEESTLQLGLLDNHPRTRELSYIFLEWRALRTIGDIRNQWNDWSALETMDYWMRETPYMDAGVARNYAYVRPSPGHGLHYTYGHFQMRQLLADVQRQRGEQFRLKDFHDEFMAAERIPISLIRYQMTGLDDEIGPLWQRQPLGELLD